MMKTLTVDLSGIRLQETKNNELYKEKMREVMESTSYIYLMLNTNQLQRFDGFDNVLHRITHVNLNKNLLCDVRSLNRLNSLTFLSISFNRLTNIDGLKNLTNLIYLDFSHNNVTNVGNLKFNVRLQILKGNKNLITQLPPLANLEELKCVDLSFNKVRYFEQFPKSIKSINLSHNLLDRLPDLCSLELCPELDTVSFNGNPMLNDCHLINVQSFIVACGMNIKCIDGSFVDEKVNLIAEWLYSQSKAKQINDQRNLVKFLNEKIPTNLLATEDMPEKSMKSDVDKKVKKILEYKHKYADEMMVNKNEEKRKTYNGDNMRIKAAIVIQSFWRGFRTRNLNIEVVKIRHKLEMSKLEIQIKSYDIAIKAWSVRDMTIKKQLKECLREMYSNFLKRDLSNSLNKSKENIDINSSEMTWQTEIIRQFMSKCDRCKTGNDLFDIKREGDVDGFFPFPPTDIILENGGRNSFNISWRNNWLNDYFGKVFGYVNRYRIYIDDVKEADVTKNYVSIKGLNEVGLHSLHVTAVSEFNNESIPSSVVTVRIFQKTSTDSSLTTGSGRSHSQEWQKNHIMENKRKETTTTTLISESEMENKTLSSMITTDEMSDGTMSSTKSIERTQKTESRSSLSSSSSYSSSTTSYLPINQQQQQQINKRQEEQKTIDGKPPISPPRTLLTESMTDRTGRRNSFTDSSLICVEDEETKGKRLPIVNLNKIFEEHRTNSVERQRSKSNI
ncbi:hypothetical protein SNEBB_000250 [Seison nebaliae]|nr:hypothetical protein SNEBB_000250 [Seison nebaliae]